MSVERDRDDDAGCLTNIQARCTTMKRQLLTAFVVARRLTLFVATVAVLVEGNASRADGFLRTVALSGQPAPGTDLETQFRSIVRWNASINNRGQVALLGTLTGPSVDATNQFGVWRELTPGTLSLVARAGDAAPGAGEGARFTNFLRSTLISSLTPWLMNDGTVLIPATIAGPGVTANNDAGTWIGAADGAISLAIREDDVAVGTPAGVRLIPSEVLISGDGQLSFFADLRGAGVTDFNFSSVWRGQAGQDPKLLIRGNQPIPSSVTASRFGSVNEYFPLTLNARGQIAFKGSLRGTGITSANDEAIWSANPGAGLEIVAQDGAHVPGLNETARWLFLDAPLINDAGSLAFYAVVSDPVLTPTSFSGFWRTGATGEPALIVREGDVALGTGADNKFTQLPTRFNYNTLGQASFRAQIGGASGANDSGIWRSVPGLPHELIAREGSQPPGVSDGAVFDDFLSSASMMNDLGQIAFTARLRGGVGGGGAGDGDGLWATDIHGQLQLIARVGDFVDVDNGPGIDLRKIRLFNWLRHLHNDSGRAASFNDLGQLVVSVGFTDNSSGVLISSRVTVPEPGLLPLLGAIGLMGVRRRFWAAAVKAPRKRDR